MRIKRLKTLVADQIAVGEVIERPASVVKELVENSIDAGSTNVEILINDGETSSITVNDNGQGIFREDLSLAFSRHATSKVEEMEDFYSLKTLGFRGEALASIASIAQVIIKTRRREENEGSMMELKGGKIIKEGEIPKTSGTGIEVMDLFYNTPVRFKHLKHPTTEFSHISSICSQLALAFPRISFSLFHNQRKVFLTNGQGNLRHTIYSLYGEDLASSLLPIDFTRDYVNIKGYLSPPTYSRKTQSQLFFYVNNRLIKSPFLKGVVQEALRDYVPKGRYPFALLKIGINPVHIDVNVHPQKLSIRFSRPETVASVLKGALRETLKEEQKIPLIYPQPRPMAPMLKETPLNLSLTFARKGKGRETVQDLQLQPISLKGLEENLIPLGQLYKTYLLFQGKGGLYLMDQHAAHERIIYENLSSSLIEKEAPSQLLLRPLTLEISPDEMAFFQEEGEKLQRLGFHFEPFGFSSLLLRAVPIDLKDLSEEGLKDLFFDLLQKNLKEKDHDLLCTISCHGAIKANQSMQKEEIKALLYDLQKTDNPFQCPHGRPTLLQLGRRELEHGFKRS